MTRSPFRLRGCRVELCRGRNYVIGETYPSGFGIWEVGGILPIASYPGHLEGWNAAVSQFLALGDKPRRMKATSRAS